MSDRAVYCFSSHGPIFGRFDICIQNDSNLSAGSLSELGNVYDFKLSLPETTESQSFLAGSKLFQIAEIETFNLI